MISIVKTTNPVVLQKHTIVTCSDGNFIRWLGQSRTEYAQEKIFSQSLLCIKSSKFMRNVYLWGSQRQNKDTYS